jgi:hypothetical protein
MVGVSMPARLHSRTPASQINSDYHLGSQASAGDRLTFGSDILGTIRDITHVKMSEEALRIA